jgi:flagella basal body P-ring formation protein FlgA
MMNRQQSVMILAATLVVIAGVGLGRPVAAAQGVAALGLAIEQFLRAQTVGLPGTVSYSIGVIDNRSPLPACAAPEVFLPPGARLWGRGHVGVRCSAPSAWTIYVPVTVQVQGSYLVAARPLPPGHALTGADVAAASGDLAQLPAGVAQDTAQVLGRHTAAPLAAGQPLRADLLRAPVVIQQGQSVKLVARGRGFEVTAEGRALAQAQLGQVVQVRGPSGQTVHGIARHDAVVEINN